MTKIDLTVHPDRLERARAKRAQERNIIIPTFAQMKNPASDPCKSESRIEVDWIVGCPSAQPVPHQLEKSTGCNRAAVLAV